jgi:hypothetical protein
MTIRFQMVLIFLTGLLSVMPPGLCPCWLIPQVETVHVHFSPEHAKSDHTHTYLLQVSQTVRVDVTPLVITSVALWIAITSVSGILLGLLSLFFHQGGWWANIPHPPPKVVYL